MKCTKCGLKEATTEVLHRHNNRIEKLYLCNDCAKGFRPDIDDDFDLLNKLINGSPMGLVASFGGLFDAPTTRTLICPECKTTSEEFIETGFVGCPRCYEVFEPLIVQTVKKLQQSDRHIGKSPFGGSNKQSEISRLKAEIQAAMDSGDFARVSELSGRLSYIAGDGKEGR